ncbi:hypothetical protein ElyMa_004310700 [Elysia marginata]|uniref:Uncharacterized protein n=1 Tax=Elysia marginata TaxID=1093978 RepID=A0AAV4GZ44_9GAST|nr:hypothetical protein ElyMa_004310700 [Elysia marginata]
MHSMNLCGQQNIIYKKMTKPSGSRRSPLEPAESRRGGGGGRGGASGGGSSTSGGGSGCVSSVCIGTAAFLGVCVFPLFLLILCIPWHKSQDSTSPTQMEIRDPEPQINALAGNADHSSHVWNSSDSLHFSGAQEYRPTGPPSYSDVVAQEYTGPPSYSNVVAQEYTGPPSYANAVDASRAQTFGLQHSSKSDGVVLSVHSDTRYNENTEVTTCQQMEEPEMWDTK